MKRIAIAPVLVLTLALGACAASSESASFNDGAPAPAAGRGDSNAGMAPPGSSSSSSSGGSASASGDGEMAGTGARAPGAQAQAGLLTAGVWDDNQNFDFFAKYLDLSARLPGVPVFSLDERQAARARWTQRAAASQLDIAFVIDTTGSMGDELRYLQNEIDHIAQTIQAKFPDATARYGLVLYKDDQDAYVSRWFDFKPAADFRAHLAAQSVGGGGDYPEAVEAGLEQTMRLGWRTGPVARLAFWVADAPHHIGDESRVRAALDTAVQSDVHVYPVAASGTDERAERTMRTAAQITGGRYVFLTDDSGIGNDHAEPHIPCYHVTKFNDAIVRMVESEMKGTRIEAQPTEIVRTVGTPLNGTCTTKSAGPVSLY